MRGWLATVTVGLAGLLGGGQPLPHDACASRPSACAAPAVGNCCQSANCCCGIDVPTARHAPPATVIPSLTLDRSTLGLPVLATFDLGGHFDAGGERTHAILSFAGSPLPLYTLSHAYLI